MSNLNQHTRSDGYCGALDCKRCGPIGYTEPKECTGCGDDIEDLGREECPECYIETLENKIARLEIFGQEPKFKEKSGNDFPMVEVRDNCDKEWHRRRYVFSDDVSHYCIIPDAGVCDWDQMRQIKPVSTEELKRLARLV